MTTSETTEIWIRLVNCIRANILNGTLYYSRRLCHWALCVGLCLELSWLALIFLLYHFNDSSMVILLRAFSRAPQMHLWVAFGVGHVLSCFSHVWLFASPWSVAHQASLSMGFCRQGYWSALPCPPPGDLPVPGIKPASLMSPAMAGGFFTTSATWEAL